MNKTLLRIALKYIEKGYSMDDLTWGDDLYGSSEETKELCKDYYEDIQAQGTNWAYLRLEE